MPFMTDNFTCPACTQAHPLFTAGNEAPDYSWRIWFTCPTTKRTVDINGPQFAWMRVEDKPQGAVGIKKRGD